ncbi:MAG: S-layer homology domain-containing protein [Clostridium sp.]|nr:S-layer homology domain-containing protein [Clostridium sp.]
MKHPFFRRGSLACLLCVTLLCSLISPASAFFWNKKADPPVTEGISKNGLVGEVISFTDQDFASLVSEGDPLTAITITALPDVQTGLLTVGGQPVTIGTVVDASALSGLRFQILPAPKAEQTTFSFQPTFASGAQGNEVTVTLYLLTEENQSPIARNMELSTYRNVSITGYFDAVDTEGDTLTFQLTSTPARGAVTVAEDGSSQFVYTPYENKTGKDTFSYVATDPAGNTSAEATVTVEISKPDTTVTYADLADSDVHKSAIRLAEEGIFVGRYVDGQYYFDAERSVSRAEFLTMAMAATGAEPMENVTLTGFSDDESIPTWAKGSVSAALKAGVIQGYPSADSGPVFGAEETVTLAEATVMLNRLLSISDVPTEVFSADNSSDHWAGQSAANLAASGVIRTEHTASASLSQELTRGEAAQLLDGALTVLDAREDRGLFW